MAGLAAVLPKNIWLHVAQIPNLSRLGKNFVLQGGTQHNLAAVKAQVDYIRSSFRGSEESPNIVVHNHCAESGAIGAAIEAIRLWESGRRSTFIGLDATTRIKYTTTINESTRCNFCKNKCLRAFIDVEIARNREARGLRFCNEQEKRTSPTAPSHPDVYRPPAGKKFTVPVAPVARRIIVGNSCQKGSVEDVDDMRAIKKELEATLKANPNLVEMSAKEVFKSSAPESIAAPIPTFALTKKTQRRIELMRKRSDLRIGIPRVLNMYSLAPLFNAYFESLGILHRNIVYSDYTTEKLYKEGVKRGSIDPCFPGKLAVPHVHNLIYTIHENRPLDIIFFPIIADMNSDLANTQACLACPTSIGTPEVVKAAFTKEKDVFKSKSITFMDTYLNVGIPNLFERQMYNQFKDVLGLTRTENTRAVAAGYKALKHYRSTMRRKAREVIEELETENRLGLVLLGRAYHNDPGINHEILNQFQLAGYPILTVDSLPIDEDILARLFGGEVRTGVISHPMEISDVWKNSFSENTNRKVWAAKYVARHANLVALEISNFKCGHDAPIYSVIEEIVETSGSPYFSFKDLDENKPAGSIKIRVETIIYFLMRHREDMMKDSENRARIREQIAAFEIELRARLLAGTKHDAASDMDYSRASLSVDDPPG